jgi:nicotinamide phosphoribosyltransferase
MKLNALTACDFYKTGHINQYPPKTTEIYSNMTPRSSRLAHMSADYDGKVVFFGLQGLNKFFLIDTFNESFFSQPKEKVIKAYKRRMDNALGPGAITTEHIEALHDLGYLPIEIKALDEGSRVNIKVPVFTVRNTLPEFYWLTNYLETVLSNGTWGAMTVATIASEYKKLLNKYAVKTGSPLDFVMWQGHDFALRGLDPFAGLKQAGHLLSFYGTDTIPAIDALEDYYGADSDKELIGGSVPATEHSVMCAGGETDELGTFKRLITELYPTGVVSIVSDTWDYWNVITNYAVQLKQDILDRQPNALGLAKVVFRPDSGNPVHIICGDPSAPVGSPEYKGSIECLYEIFGGELTSTGHKLLNQRVGLIYGDSITLNIATEILSRLDAKGFASGNVVLGIGSFTYQYNTRDTFGFAMKATYSVVDGVGHELFKDPKTDSGTKKSAKGLLRVEKEGNDFVLYDQQTLEQEKQGELKTRFLNGKIVNEQSLSEIRDILSKS